LVELQFSNARCSGVFWYAGLAGKIAGVVKMSILHGATGAHEDSSPCVIAVIDYPVLMAGRTIEHIAD